MNMYLSKPLLAGVLFAAVGGATSGNALVVNIPDALDQTGNFSVNTDIDDILGEESVYLVGTMEVSNTSGEYLFGNLFLEISTSAPASAGAQRIGVGNVVNTNDWGVNGSGNVSSGIDVELDTPTTLALKINQLTGDYSFWVNPDFGAEEPVDADLTGNSAGAIDGIGFIRLRGGRYGSIPVNTNSTDFTNVALYTGDDTPFNSTPAIPGDTDGDGDIDDADLGTSFSNYTGPLAPGVGGKDLSTGDTDGDGDVDDADLGTSFSGYTGPLAAAVPEPTSLALIGLGGLLVARRRRA